MSDRAPAPTLDALLDLFKRGVVHPLAPAAWRVSGLAPYASLYQAIAAGDLYAVEDRVRAGADIQERDEKGQTPLLAAAAENQPYIADFLLDHGAILTDQDALGNSVMHLTARATHIYTLEHFLRRGANIEARNGRNYTPLHIAAEAGDTFAVHHLVTLGADMFAMQDPTVLSIPSVLAARQRHWAVTRYFRSRSQFFSLHLMAAQGDEAGVIEALDDMPPAVNLLDALQNTPLISAVRTGERGVVQLLLERGADSMTKNMEGDFALALALRLDRLDCAELLLSSQADINILLDSGFERTLLGEAVRSGTLARVRFILDHGGDSRAVWEGGRTALHVAVEVNDPEKTQLLVERGAASDALNETGWSPLLVAARNGSTAVLEAMAPTLEMLERPSPEGRRLLHEAAAQGHADTVAWLLDHGTLPDSLDTNGESALHRAAAGGHVAAATLLMDRGAPLESADKAGCTPFLTAVAEGSEALARLMLDRGADRDRVDGQQRNAVFIALEHGQTALARFLVDQGVSATAKDKFRHSALFPAARTGDENTLAWLAGLGLSVADRDGQGRSPLYVAIQSGALESARYLIQHGAPPDDPDKSGTRPIHLAAERGNRLVLQLLLRAAVDVRSKNSAGIAPIHVAARKGRVESIVLLAAMGADVNDRDGNGMTPLYIAVGQGHYDVAATLLHLGASLINIPEMGPSPIQLVEVSLKKVEPLAKNYARAERLRLRALLDAVVREEFRRAATWGDQPGMEGLLATYPQYRDEASFGLAPAHWAARHGQTAILKLLQAHGADLQLPSQTEEGNTPIHFAARYKHPETVAWLVEAGVPADLKSLSGKTADQIASEGAVGVVTGPAPAPPSSP